MESTDGEEVGAHVAPSMLERWADVARWLERHQPSMSRRALEALEVTIAALSSAPDENNG